jgi:membrane-associated phospholipid phosphatase
MMRATKSPLSPSQKQSQKLVLLILRTTFFLLISTLAFQFWKVLRVWSNYTGAILFGTVLIIGALVWIRRAFLLHGHGLYQFFSSIFGSVGQAIAENPEVGRLRARHSAIFKFLKVRLDWHQFTGLPLSLLGLFFLYIFALFIGLVEDVLSMDPIVAIDGRLEHLFYAFRNQQLEQFFFWFTLLAKGNILTAFAVSLTLLLWLRREQLYILPLWIALAGSGLTTYLGKLAFRRVRPSAEIPVYLESSFSFPSGHATAAVAFYGFIVFMAFRHHLSWRFKINILFLMVGLILAIGLSRLYLGVHYLSDIFGGYLIGLLWIILGISVFEWIAHKRKGRQEARATSSAVKKATVLLVAAPLCYYVFYAINYKPPPISYRQQAEIQLSNVNFQSVFSDYRLPRFTETLTGAKQEPLSLILVAKNDEELFQIMNQAGWYLADPASPGTILKLAKAAYFAKEYLKAPMTPSFWNSQVNDFGFEMPTETNSVKQRHHARFWKTQFKTEGRSIYVGTVSLDTGLKWGWAHRIGPNIDGEREKMVADLLRKELIAQAEKIPFTEPAVGKNFLADPFFSDGKLFAIYLKPLN